MTFDRIRDWWRSLVPGHSTARPSTPEEKPQFDAAREMIESVLDAVPANGWWGNPKLTEIEPARRLLESSPEIRRAAVLLACERLTRLDTAIHRIVISTSDRNYKDRCVTRSVLSALLRAKLPLSEADLCLLLRWISPPEKFRFQDAPVGGVIGALERYAAEHALSPELRCELDGLKSLLDKTASTRREHRLLSERIGRLLGTGERIGVQAGEAWSDRLLEQLHAMDEPVRTAWEALLAHAAGAVQAKPGRQWLQTAGPLIESIGIEAFRAHFTEWAALVGKPSEKRAVLERIRLSVADSTQLSDRNSDILRGLIWCCASRDDEAVARTLGDLGQVCFAKIPNVGARCPKVGNACVYALSVMPGTEGIAQLTRLKTRVKNNSARKMIEKALAEAARRSGVTPDDIEEISVPTYGLSEPGFGCRPVGEFTAEIRVTGTDGVALHWRKEKGRPQKSVPADLQREHPEAVKELKRAVKDLQKMLPAQAGRIERLLLVERSWDLQTWRERYLDHPLMATLARRLIWFFSTDGGGTLGTWWDGKLVDEQDRPLDEFDAGKTQVRLWHPLGSPAETVLAWRLWLERHEVSQPFKQAHREVYILTDAEMQTETYSNRFAAHILRQHQLAALCRERGWKYHLQGNFDGCNYPAVELPRWDLRAEFWVEPTSQDATGAGIFLYLSADQVRFYRMDSPEPMRLVDVPALPFSEVMRDVDLFVAVTSIANDPQWQDRGAGYVDYWWQNSFGELASSAQIRREVLDRLVPRLRIADRCSVTDRFLIVRGDLRTYKIHLGSGNILMQPNDEYLCIVPGSSSETYRPDRLFLPFEGDRTLSVILSKAFLLAADHKIADPTITRQIRRK